MKIRLKIFAIAIALVLATGIGTIVVSYSVSKGIVTGEVYARLETTAQSRADHIETTLSNHREFVEMMAVGNAFVDVVDESKNYTWRMEQINRRITNTRKICEDICGIMVLDTNGTVIASSAQNIGRDESATAIFQRGKDGVYTDDLRICEQTGDPVIGTAAPILVDGEFAGVTVVYFDAEDGLFKITTDGTGLGETGEVYLVNRDNYMISPSRNARDVVLNQLVGEIEHTGEEDCGHAAVLTKNYLGTDVLRVHKHIDEMNWVLVSEISQEEALAPVTGLTRMLFIITIFLLAAGIVVSAILSGTITEPIVTLQKGIVAMEMGDEDRRVETDADDEIGELSRAFERMLSEVRQSRAELEEYNLNLETQIEERTKRLTESEEYLKELVNKLRISQEGLSAPVVQIWDRILALPLIGAIDEQRIETIMGTLLSEVTRTQSDVVILDVTGVHEIDTYVTNQLIRIVAAAQLLGADCIVTGVRPESAQTIVELGIDMSDIVTRRTLQEGLAYALKLTGGGLTREERGSN